MSIQVQKETKKRLGERLVDAGLIDEIQLTVALGMQKQTGLKIGQQLLKLGFLSEEELSPFLSDAVDMSVSLSQRNISPQTLRAVSQDLAFRYKVIPVAFDGKTIVLAMSDPDDIKTVDDLAFRLSKKIHPVRALEWDIDTALLKYYSDFTDEEIAKLTSASSAAKTYQDAQWATGGQEVDIKNISNDPQRGMPLAPTSHGDAGKTPGNGGKKKPVIAGHDDWTADPMAKADTAWENAIETNQISSGENDDWSVNPLEGLESHRADFEPSKPAVEGHDDWSASVDPALPTAAALEKKPQKTTQPPQPASRPSAPQQRPAAQKPQAKPQAQARPKAPQRPQAAPQKAQPAQPSPAAAPAQEKPSSPNSDALSALASTARKRFTVQQALVDLLIEKKIITERDLLNKLIKLEGSLGDED
jgi:hypothetical protein